MGYRAGIIDQEKQSANSGRIGSWLGAALLAALLALGVVACGDSASGGGAGGSTEGSSGQVVGAGSTAQEVPQEHWTSESFYGPKEVGVSYEPVGSYAGIERFLAGEVAFAGSDVPLAADQLGEAEERCRPGQAIEIPVYLSALEIAYNLSNSGVFLRPDTVAKIFNGEISRWDDPVIRRQNPSISSIGLPRKLPIAPLYRAGESGATLAFTEYLSASIPSVWKSGASPAWPLENGESAEGTKGVIEAIYAREGAVGYVDSSQRSTLGVVTVKVGTENVLPSSDTVAAAFAKASEDKSLSANRYMLPFKLDRKGSPGAYPMTLVSYLIACTRYDSAEEAATLKAYLKYAISAEGQEDVGSAPFPAALRPRIRAAVEAIG